MIILELFRKTKLKDCTLGELIIDSSRLCYTMELPYKNNELFISSIPTGVYKIENTYSPALKKETPLLLDTGKRTCIRIHSAGKPSDLKGCIGVSTDYTIKDNTALFTNSRNTFNYLMDTVFKKDDDITLIIKDLYE